MAARRDETWTGLIDFAGIMLLIVGLFNLLQGLAVLFQEERITVTPARFVGIDLTTWGWALLLFGLAMVAVGSCLLMRQTWARIVAVLLVGIHAVGQVVSLGASPIWSLLMLALDTAVIFALTVEWSTAVSPSPDPNAPIDDLRPSVTRQQPTFR
jgi:hypothetical protein